MYLCLLCVQLLCNRSASFSVDMALADSSSLTLYLNSANVPSTDKKKLALDVWKSIKFISDVRQALDIRIDTVSCYD